MSPGPLWNYAIEVLCQAFGPYALVLVEDEEITARVEPAGPSYLSSSVMPTEMASTWTIIVKRNAQTPLTALDVRIQSPTLTVDRETLLSESDVAGYFSLVRTKHLRGEAQPIHPYANEGEMPYAAREAWRRFSRTEHDTPSSI